MLRPMEGLGIGLAIANADGIPIADFGVTPDRDGEEQRLEAGQRMTARVDVKNLLMDGRYFVHLGVNRGAGQGGVALYVNSATDFAVFGGWPTASIISLPHEIETDIETPKHEETAR
jgi:hypothetical protein